MNSSIKRNTTVQTVLNEFRRDIIMGELKDGTSVKEVEFSEHYGCSRAALRGAIDVLEQEGLITFNSNGTKNISSLNDSDINNLYTLRSYIECSAMEQILQKHVKNLSPLLAVLEQAQNDFSEGFLDSDALFHSTLIALSGNKALIQTWHTFAPVIREVFSLNLKISTDLADSFSERHLVIVRMLINGDRSAIDILKSHIEEARVLSLRKEKK